MPRAKQLTALLTAARDQKVTIKPPPARATRRFPVEWPVALGTSRGAVKAAALDVSTGGMFVKPERLARARCDDRVLDGARRWHTRRSAGARRSCGSSAKPKRSSAASPPGFGLAIIEMTEADRMRWLGFLARIERRAEKRVLSAPSLRGSPSCKRDSRVAVTSSIGGTDPGALVQLAKSDAPPCRRRADRCGVAAKRGVCNARREPVLGAQCSMRHDERRGAACAPGHRPSP